MTATYITTTIPYVNARPHIGHALELVQADVLARHRRGRGGAVRPVPAGPGVRGARPGADAVPAGRGRPDHQPVHAPRRAAPGAVAGVPAPGPSQLARVPAGSGSAG